MLIERTDWRQWKVNGAEKEDGWVTFVFLRQYRDVNFFV